MTSAKGTYALVLQSVSDFEIDVGRLGTVAGPSGFFIYVGSAFGPGGLKARLAHHLRPAAKPHWHIDFFKQHAPIIDIWYTTDSNRREHQWASILSEKNAGRILFPGFGSSDCDCPSHLLYFPDHPSVHRFRRLARQTIPAHSPISQMTLP